MLLLLSRLKPYSFEIDRLRIFDFYLLFPYEMTKITLPKELMGMRKEFEYTGYNDVPNSKRVFAQLEPFHQKSIQYLASAGLIELKELKKGKVKRTRKPIPKELQTLIENENTSNHPNWILILKDFQDFELFGENGLKHRTGLMEYRYDSFSS